MSTAMRRAASPGTSVGCTLWGRVIGLGSTGDTKRESLLPRGKVMNGFTPFVQASFVIGTGRRASTPRTGGAGAAPWPPRPAGIPGIGAPGTALAHPARQFHERGDT